MLGTTVLAFEYGVIRNDGISIRANQNMGSRAGGLARIMHDICSCVALSMNDACADRDRGVVIMQSFSDLWAVCEWVRPGARQ